MAGHHGMGHHGTITSSVRLPIFAMDQLLRLLDADASGLVELDEFVTGCLSLHGTAKSRLALSASHGNHVFYL